MPMRIFARALRVAALLGVFAPAPATQAVPIDWVAVGNPGNAADTTGYGSVASAYQISKYEITNAQYAEFLNAVADTDPNGLYNANMASGTGGIIQLGVSGLYNYLLVPGREERPVN